MENGAVISQRIAHSFNIVSSIASKRSLEKAGHFFSFTVHGEERWSHVSFPPPTTFIPLRRSTQEKGRRRGSLFPEEVDRVQVDAVAKQALTPTNDQASQHLEGIREQATQRCVAWKPRGSFQSTFYYTTCLSPLYPHFHRSYLLSYFLLLSCTHRLTLIQMMLSTESRKIIIIVAMLRLSCCVRSDYGKNGVVICSIRRGMHDG